MNTVPTGRSSGLQKHDAHPTYRVYLSSLQTAYNQLKAAGTYYQLILKWGLTNEELTAVDRRLIQSLSTPVRLHRGLPTQ
jgi:hypothetical protein